MTSLLVTDAQEGILAVQAIEGIIATVPLESGLATQQIEGLEADDGRRLQGSGGSADYDDFWVYSSLETMIFGDEDEIEI